MKNKENKTKNKGGRPSKYCPEIVEKLCTEFRQGKTVKQACDKAGISRETLYEWLDRNEEFADMYTRAREIGYMVLADEIIELSDDAGIVATNEGTGSAEVQAKRLQVDSRKWLLSKMLRAKFGDRTEVEVAGKDGGPVAISFEEAAKEAIRSIRSGGIPKDLMKGGEGGFQ